MSESVVTNIGTCYVEEWYRELDITLCLIHYNWMDIRALGFIGYKMYIIMLTPMYIGLLFLQALILLAYYKKETTHNPCHIPLLKWNWHMKQDAQNGLP